MTKNNGKKLGVGAILARILVVIVVMAVGGVASFFGSKTFFASKFQKDKKAEIAKQLKEESKERVDVAMINIGDSVTLRIYHNKNQQMIYVPLRSDMELTLDSDGKMQLVRALRPSQKLLRAVRRRIVKESAGEDSWNRY
jgi:flagellar basal body-associated protein FliL